MSSDNIIVKLNGGLGNQMFQWALARMIEERTDIKTLLDMSYFKKGYARAYQLGIFKLKASFVEDFWTKSKLELMWFFRKQITWGRCLGINLYSESCFQFDSNINRVKPNTHVEGFFQSERYFKSIENILRNDFAFVEPPEGENRKLVQQIQATNSISLHIRRGDYVQKKRYQNAYADCSLDYYKRGVEHIMELLENKSVPPVLYIFSDDIDWVKNNLKLPYESIYVAHNTGDKSYEDMRLMSLCKHNIIANSSFSWWGAWLNKNPDKVVIAPQKWFNDEKIVQTDIIPETWIRLEN